MNIHFIAIGGSAMHNLAIALHKKGYKVTGSDDEIFEPSKSRLAKYNLMPNKYGWDISKIDSSIDAIILGMHAREDNPELLKAQELGLKIFSYPEYIYEQTKDKTRVVIGGSHGKTTITAMIMHVLHYHNINHDYMVGAQLDGFETMVKLSKDAKIAIIEGDEYLSSPIDRRPKFHLYQPNIALLSGIAWDHINVFPTYENYVYQFEKFVNLIQQDGALVYFDKDKDIATIVKNSVKPIGFQSYDTPEYEIVDGVTYLKINNQRISLEVFGEHNLQNIMGAKYVCNKLGLSDDDFFKAIQKFKGASKRLQLLAKNNSTNVFLDFAHSPSKLKATTKAVKTQFSGRELVACMELHTFSSLKEDFLPQYKGAMTLADKAYVYFNPETLKHKKLNEITVEQVANAFGGNNVTVFTDKDLLLQNLLSINWHNKNLLLMSSGNFSGIDFKKLSADLLTNN